LVVYDDIINGIAFKVSIMLRLLRIRNLALVRELEIEFGRGLNLLTGETGSGKSILVDALGLLLGTRASQEMIRSDCDTAVLEGIFEIGLCQSAKELLLESGFEIEDDLLLIRREISVSGRNRIFLNNNLATLSLLKSLGDRLADIHGQQEQRSLLDLSTHRQWLDEFGGNTGLLEPVQSSFRKLQELARQLELLETNEQERLRRIDILQFQIDEIRKVGPLPGEKEELENEHTILTNRERILSLATDSYATLYESEASVLVILNHLEKLFSELAGFDRNWTAHLESLRDIRYKMEDLAYAARDYADENDFSPERLEEVNQRQYALDKLIKKYGSSCEEILAFLARSEMELGEMLSTSESVAHLSETFAQELEIYQSHAEKLSAKRKDDAGRLEHAVRKEFAALAMERMELRVHFHANRHKDRHERIPDGYGLQGLDSIEFLIAPNKGEEIRPLAKIASGGELSRLMLAIKSLCGSEDEDRTLVFDEVDAGIGGRVAEAVGRRLVSLSEKNQVLCVTHLPQIAAFAHQHFNIRKEVVGERTETFIKSLNETDRIEEISRMLGGETITEATRHYALELRDRSGK
jgi:DNA repair protein RecN (Recombination protein N)